tara:strand:- start:84 stop:449 length:366 start_codon:yes stop_codon:yes gene_type:complete
MSNDIYAKALDRLMGALKIIADENETTVDNLFVGASILGIKVKEDLNDGLMTDDDLSAEDVKKGSSAAVVLNFGIMALKLMHDAITGSTTVAKNFMAMKESDLVRKATKEDWEREQREKDK